MVHPRRRLAVRAVVAVRVPLHCKRLPHNTHAGSNIELRALFTDVRFALVTVSVFMSEFAVFIPYTYISSYAIHVGFTTQQAFLLNALVNLGAIPGRALPGFLADRVGAFNILGTTTSVCAVLMLAMWCTSASHAAVVSFAVLFGFWSGATIGLTAVCISRVCDIQDVGKRTGTAYCVASIGLLIGAPTAGAIIRCNDGAYWGVAILSGSLYIAATVGLFLTKGVAAGWSPKVVF